VPSSCFWAMATYLNQRAFRRSAVRWTHFGPSPAKERKITAFISCFYRQILHALSGLIGLTPHRTDVSHAATKGRAI
jgi:hypothetical protein